VVEPEQVARVVLSFERRQAFVLDRPAGGADGVVVLVAIE
jgi:hypothetical protein